MVIVLKFALLQPSKTLFLREFKFGGKIIVCRPVHLANAKTSISFRSVKCPSCIVVNFMQSEKALYSIFVRPSGNWTVVNSSHLLKIQFLITVRFGGSFMDVILVPSNACCSIIVKSVCPEKSIAIGNLH
jgi:phage FluMu protein Com